MTDRELLEKAARWKTVACPKCGSNPNESCFRAKLGVPWIFERVAPHVARLRAAAAMADATAEG